MNRWGVTARDAGLALRARLGSRCEHPADRSEPVILSTGEIVALLCGVCLDELPISWGCTSCEWAEVRTFGSAVPDRILARLCREHEQTG